MKLTHLAGKRKAISPVLATVILIAITLIAAIAIAGFVFGLFGSFTKTAQVSASVTSCVWTAGTGEVCTLSMINSGTSNTNANACTMTYGGATYAGTVGGTTKLTAGTTVSTTCTASSSAPTSAVDAGAGTAIVGAVSTSNGGQVPWTGQSSS